jgi:2-polyprenyl-6-methoxyphenol hydroxylase-like FAD-dependent oxidoreductase
VTVVERSEFPRTKPCGEYLSPATVRALRQLGVAAALEPHAVAVHGIRLHNRRAQARLKLRTPGWSLPRSVLDDALLTAAREAGARVVRGRVEDLREIRTKDGALQSIDAAFVIGADGAHSTIAKRAGLTQARSTARRFALGGHYLGLRSLEQCIEMFVKGRGYFAINPFSETSANVMLIVEERALQEHRDDLDRFIAESAADFGVDCGFSKARLHGKRVAIGPLDHSTTHFTAEHLLLIGDAAHFLDPFTGQGVYLALYGAKIAAQCIVSVVRGGVPEVRARAEFERRLRREIARRGRLARVASTLVRLPALAPAAPLFTPLLGAIAG